MTHSAPIRALLGFAAAALSVLTFHQGMWAALHLAQLQGLGMPAPYPLDAIPPLGIPRIVNLCFWGGLYGAAFGLAAPWLPRPLWLSGFALGCIAVVFAAFIVPALKGGAIGGGGAMNWLRGVLINGCWGVGVGLIYPLLAGTRSAPRLRDA